MTERQLHAQGGIEKGKLRLSQTPLGCGQVLTGMAPRGEKSQEGEEVSAECRELQAAATVRPIRGRSFHVSARVNTPDAKGIETGKKPREPYNPNIHRQTAVGAPGQQEQGGTKKRGRGHQSTRKARIGKNIKGCSKRDRPDKLRKGRKGRKRTPTRGQIPERWPSQDKERPRKRVPSTLQGEEERKKNSRPS